MWSICPICSTHRTLPPPVPRIFSHVLPLEAACFLEGIFGRWEIAPAQVVSTCAVRRCRTRLFPRPRDWCWLGSPCLTETTTGVFFHCLAKRENWGSDEKHNNDKRKRKWVKYHQFLPAYASRWSFNHTFRQPSNQSIHLFPSIHLFHQKKLE